MYLYSCFISVQLLFTGKCLSQSRGNTDESKVLPYTLPDPLVLSNGKKVTDAKTWWNQRRPEILSMFEDQVFWQNAQEKTSGEF